MVEAVKKDTGINNLDHGHNGPFCHYCMGQGVGTEGEVPAEANGVLCRTHLNDPHIFGFYEVELNGTDFEDQLSVEMRQLIDSGFIERGRAEFNATLARMATEKSALTVTPQRAPRMRSGQ